MDKDLEDWVLGDKSEYAITLDHWADKDYTYTTTWAKLDDDHRWYTTQGDDVIHVLCMRKGQRSNMAKN